MKRFRLVLSVGCLLFLSATASNVEGASLCKCLGLSDALDEASASRVGGRISPFLWDEPESNQVSPLPSKVNSKDGQRPTGFNSQQSMCPAPTFGATGGSPSYAISGRGIPQGGFSSGGKASGGISSGENAWFATPCPIFRSTGRRASFGGGKMGIPNIVKRFRFGQIHIVVNIHVTFFRPRLPASPTKC